MRRADRLFDIVQRLRGGRLVTARKLAEQFEVSERTIYRDIADLMASGVPIDGEAGVGYLMRAGYDVPPLMFTKPEVEAIVIGLRLAAAVTGARIAAASAEAMIKVEAALPDDLKPLLRDTQIYAPIWRDEGRKGRFDLMQQAIDEKRRLAFTYRRDDGAETNRIVRPLAMQFWGQVWTLAAWCELREDFRLFRPDRMIAPALGERFRPERGRALADFFHLEKHREGARSA
jgi:predicted DNA-binding transcriptional regulator YafY